MLRYVGQEYDERRYDIGHFGATQSEWLDHKHTLGLDFPQLPYLIVDDTDNNSEEQTQVKLTQTIAILRHFARRFKLDGSTEREKDLLAMLEQQIIDLLFSFLKFVHRRSPKVDAPREEHEQHEKVKQQFEEDLTTQLKLLSNFLNKQDGQKTWILGSKISYVDFMLYDYFFWLNYQPNSICAKVLAKFDNLVRFVEKFESLPQLSVYIKTIKPNRQ